MRNSHQTSRIRSALGPFLFAGAFLIGSHLPAMTQGAGVTPDNSTTSAAACYQTYRSARTVGEGRHGRTIQYRLEHLASLFEGAPDDHAPLPSVDTAQDRENLARAAMSCEQHYGPQNTLFQPPIDFTYLFATASEIGAPIMVSDYECAVIYVVLEALISEREETERQIARSRAQQAFLLHLAVVPGADTQRLELQIREESARRYDDLHQAWHRGITQSGVRTSNEAGEAQGVAFSDTDAYKFFQSQVDACNARTDAPDRRGTE